MANALTQTALRSLEQMVDTERLVTNPVQLVPYERDAGLDKGKPDGIFFPHTTNEVIRVMQWAHKYRVPLIARGAGTGLAGGAVPEYGGILIEFSHMREILDFDKIGRSVVVQTGLVTNKLDEIVRKEGLYYPPDPSSGRSSSIGGNIGANSGGPHCFKYGVTTNYVTGLEVVLADGRLVHLGGRALDYPEYDLMALVTGGEGTLGIVTEASLRLLRNPPAVKTLMAAFNSVEAAGAAVSRIIAQGLLPATIEMMDQKIVNIVEDYSPAGLTREAGAVMIIEVDGYPVSIDPQMAEVEAILRDSEAFNIRIAQTEAERQKIWFGRKSAAGSMARLAPAFYLVDGTVPRSKLADTLSKINQICHDEEIRVGYVFHAGDGNLHPLLLIEHPHDPEFMERIHVAGRRIMQLCVDQGGSITGEHGVGIEKRAFMPIMYDVETLRAMRDIKDVFDPEHLLNPRKLFPDDTPDPAPLPAPKAAPKSPFAPKTAEEAAEALRAWGAQGKTVRIRGNGTKSAGLPDTDAVLTTEGFRGVRVYAPDDMYVSVGTGTTLQELQAELAKDRMWVPLASPWEQATLGGMFATNINAPLRMRYGSIRDMLLAATVALPNGRVISIGRAVVKNVAGYDLPRLFVGSHGTLGFITEVTLKLYPLPRARASLIAPVNDLSQGLALSEQILPLCMIASSLLLCRGVTNLPGNAPYTLVYTGEGVAKDNIATELTQARSVVSQHGANGVVVDGPSGSEVWAAMLREAPASGMSLRIGVPPKNLPHLLRSVLPFLGDAPFVADIANGMVYAHGVQEITRIRREARYYEGYAVVQPSTSLTNDVDRWGYKPDSLDLMRQIKARWDEQNILNPGAFLV